MKKTDQNRIADFLVRNAPMELVEGLTVLEKLKLPIHDKYSFQQQLAEMAEQADDKSKPIIETMIGQFRAQDFPILSVENAFEKYWNKFQPFPFPFPRLVPPFELPEEPRYEPPICDVYDQTFGRGTLAANCACQAYAEAHRGGFNHLQAVVIGHFAGQRARRTGRCEV